MDDEIKVGDRVILKRWYAGSRDMDRDKEFGPEAKLAIGTVTQRNNGNSVHVLWDDPSYIRDDYGDPSTQWSELWFYKVGRLDLSAPDKIEAFLNGR